MTYGELWQALPAEARARACVAFWRADDELSQVARPAALSTLVPCTMTRTGGKEGTTGAALVNTTANNVQTTRNEIVLWKLFFFISPISFAKTFSGADTRVAETGR